jgi:isopropylmalate/homocitrate/citramalate synthase
MSDSTRVPIETFEEVVPILVKEGKVDRLRLSDTVGAMGPFGMAYLVKHLRRIANQTPLEIHPHGFFGLATANALAAVSAGASVVSSSFNGLSARGGNARTEEVIVSLKMLMGVNLDYIRYDKLYETSRLIQKLTGVYVPRGKAVVGDELFAYENPSGYVSGNYFDFPFSGAPYTPEFVGQTRRLVLSKKSNRMAVKTKLEQLGIKASNEQQDAIMKECIKYAHQNKRILSDDDVRDIVRKMIDK